MKKSKTIVVDGMKFARDSRSGYYLHSKSGNKTGIRLHRYVWEKYNGPIPKGHEIHHIDHDRENNDISNLALLTAEDHRALHAKEMSAERREWCRKNIIAKAVPAAAKWHSSEDGKDWHKDHYEKMRTALHIKREIVCANCGRTYVAEQGRFCSNRCKTAWRLKSGIDNERRTCAICGANFYTNKYRSGRTCSRHCTAILIAQKKKARGKCASSR